MIGGGCAAWEELFGAYFGMQQAEGQAPPLQRPERVTLNEWETVSEMAASSVTGLFNKFIELASEYWQAGIDKHRGGDEKAEFVGDPMEGAMKSAANLFAYVKQCEEDGILNAMETDDLNEWSYDAFKLLTKVKKANEEKANAEEGRKAREEEASKSGLVIP